MALIEVYGEQVAFAQQPAAPVQVTNTNRAPAVSRQFPPGDYFTRNAGWLPRAARGIARFLSRLDRRKAAFEKNIDPRQADELLDEWEQLYGIEVDPSLPIEDRRDAVLTKVRSLGGVTAEYYEALAADFGYGDAVVTDLANPATCISTCVDFVNGLERKLTMLVTAASQGASRDQQLQDLIDSQLLAGWFAVYDFT